MSSLIFSNFIKDSSHQYGRLNTEDSNKPNHLPSKCTSMWFSTHNLTKSISKHNKKVEKEEVEMLLGEPRLVNRDDQERTSMESSIFNQTETSDTECIMKVEQSDSDSEEDIDSVFEEFEQKLKVTTAGLKEKNLKFPSVGSWNISMLCIFFTVIFSFASAISISLEVVIPFALSVSGSLEMLDDRFMCNQIYLIL